MFWAHKIDMFVIVNKVTFLGCLHKKFYNINSCGVVYSEKKFISSMLNSVWSVGCAISNTLGRGLDG
jgi:hypothetical protein